MVMNAWSNTSATPYIFILWYSIYHRTYSFRDPVSLLTRLSDGRSNSGGGSEIFLLIQTSRHFGAHLASYSIGNRTILWGQGGRGVKLTFSPPSSAEVKSEWSYASVPLQAFMSWLGTLNVNFFLSHRPILIKILRMFVNKVLERICILCVCKM